MHLDIETLTQRLDAINQLRVERALAATGPLCRRIYSELPLLFHHNHPAIPGYIKGAVPHGICFYEANALQQQSLNHYSSIWGEPIQPTVNNQPAIAALYSMGSSSSIAKTCSSDLDIWICLQPHIKAPAMTALQEKCQLLSAWANNQGVAISFFIIDEQRFRHPENYYPENHDDCHATQDLLLLEEFYRTAVRLAGKRILWYLVPVALEPYYEESLLPLYEQGIIDKLAWFDLGGLRHLSVSGCLSAARGQMYNSRHAPHKAVLKNLLLEIYAWEYPKSRFLALDFKERLQCDQMSPFALDPYCMMLERITSYLKTTHDLPRLERVRRCFYFKVCDNAAHPTTGTGWRREILQQLIKQWDWNATQITRLDNRRHWRLEETQEACHELFNEMLESYYNLQRFANRRPLSAHTSLQEHGWLISTLSTALEMLPDSSSFMPPQIIPQLFGSDDPSHRYATP